MKKTFILVTFDDVDTYEYPIEWFDKLVKDTIYFRVLGCYKKDINVNDRYE